MSQWRKSELSCLRLAVVLRRTALLLFLFKWEPSKLAQMSSVIALLPSRRFGEGHQTTNDQGTKFVRKSNHRVGFRGEEECPINSSGVGIPGYRVFTVPSR